MPENRGNVLTKVEIMPVNRIYYHQGTLVSKTVRKKKKREKQKPKLHAQTNSMERGVIVDAIASPSCLYIVGSKHHKWKQQTIICIRLDDQSPNQLRNYCSLKWTKKHVFCSQFHTQNSLCNSYKSLAQFVIFSSQRRCRTYTIIYIYKQQEEGCN